eukprot:1227462-Rhodomonas_salina.7
METGPRRWRKKKSVKHPRLRVLVGGLGMPTIPMPAAAYPEAYSTACSWYKAKSGGSFRGVD